MAVLYVLQGPDKGRSFRTTEEITILGRGSEHVPLTDRTVSRRHAELRLENGAWIIVDMRSANGTYVNGIRIEKPVRLKHGDQIKIGSTLVVYGGDEQSSRTSGGFQVARDMVDLDASSRNMDSAILSSIPVNEESVILAAPETAEAARGWKVMYELSEVIGTLSSPQQLLERVMDIIFEQIQVDRAFILVREPTSTEMLPAVVRYRDARMQQQGRISTSQRIINTVVDSKQGILCTNAMTDARFQSNEIADSIHDYGLRSVICAPIMVRDEVFGVIHVDSSMSTHTYTQGQLRMIAAIGHMTGLALQNAWLIESRMQTARLAAVGETVASLSHSIKNILQGIRSGSDLVEMGLRRQQMNMIGQGWQVVEKNLDKILHLSMNMLAYSKPREPRVQMAQLNPIVTEAVVLSQRKADEKSVMLLTDLEDSFPPVPIDVDGIHQVALNLILNAVDAVPAETGLVNVETRFDSEKGWAILDVKDNGPGIPQEQRRKLFEPFFSTKGQGGTGLGLAVAHKIIQEHRGRIEVISKPGEGTIMRVMLPTASQAAEEASADTFGPAK